MHLRQGGPNEMLSSFFCSVSRPSWFKQAYMLYGPCLCIFSKVQDSQKILIFENEALQKAWAVLLIALKNVFKCTAIFGSASVPKQLDRHCGNRQHEQNCREVAHGVQLNPIRVFQSLFSGLFTPIRPAITIPVH